MTKKQNSPGYSSSHALRWMNIAVRTAHMAMAGTAFGGVMLGVPPERMLAWRYLAVVGGILLLALEWLHDANWPHRGMGLMVYFHMLLVLLAHLFPGLAIPLLWGILISGCVGAHMPRRYRHWSILHGPEQKREKS